MAEKKRVGMVSLGCPKNLVDSEVMMGMLARQGFEITNDSQAADVLVVNTCGFIDSARQESVNTILEMAQLKQTGSLKRLVVAGCLVERFGEELCAWIRLKQGNTMTDLDVRSFCRDRIAHFKIPRYIRFVDEFPTTVTGKIQKFVMREAVEQRLGLKAAKSA